MVRTSDIGDTTLSNGDLLNYAKKNAIEHSFLASKRHFRYPIRRMNVNYKFILSVYKSLNEDVRKDKSIPPAAEWLLDNFYIIEEQTKQIRKDFRKKNYKQLPILKSGAFAGYARIFAISSELVSFTDGQLTESTILKYLTSYQSLSSLYDREIWALPLFIRLALFENIRNLCEKIQSFQLQWHKADEVFEDWMDNDVIDTSRGIKLFKKSLTALDGTNPLFTEHLFYHLRRSGRNYTSILEDMNKRLLKLGTQTEEVARKAHSMQSIHTVSMGNSITSLRILSTLDWSDLFDETSFVEQILREDPDGTYPRMDTSSRNKYRSTLEKLATKLKVSEIHLAKKAVEMAQENSCDEHASEDPEKARKKHVGYYIIGDGKNLLFSQLTNQKQTLKSEKTISSILVNLYISTIVILTLSLFFITVYYSLQINLTFFSILFNIILSLTILISCSEIIIRFVNWLALKIFPPRVFPKLSLEEGIPPKLSTIVVIPALLPDLDTVNEVLKKLECHYLANRESNLYFTLIGAYKDSLKNINDESIVHAALDKVEELNNKYCKNSTENLFYFFHRKSQFNKKNGLWIGWERKRGALLEFNDFVLGSTSTIFSHFSCKNPPFSQVKYIITLDSDTVLPMGMAKKMIATMAHPLNMPIIDEKKGIVVDGYGIMQPLVDFSYGSSNKSIFSEIYTGQKGIDPYASATSDVYQDLFGEGIYTGKGIYDLRVFQEVLKTAIPDNMVLSHDLLEGSYARTGLVTDLRLIDSHPTKYIPYLSRSHRWTRGDWQLIPFTRNTIDTKNKGSVKNPLSLLSKWKIFDNMRRSLVFPSLLVLILLTFSCCYGNEEIWFGVFTITLFISFFISLSESLTNKFFWKHKFKKYTKDISGLKSDFLQAFLSIVFLPYQSLVMINAVFISLSRIFITKKNTLEWTTASDTNKTHKNSLLSHILKMNSCWVSAFLIFAFSFYFKPTLLYIAMFFSILWFSAPFIGYFISMDKKVKKVNLSKTDIQSLRIIARKTWRFFEEFMNKKNNYLPPDNYQTDPPRGIANRTSPTNIGLGLLSILTARDFGYITTSDMINRIEHTVTTMEALDKWQGHLHNWYDTYTLKTLKPSYISTVDSGNLLCYLITLREGIKNYLQLPFVTINFIQGFYDTLLCSDKECTESNHCALPYSDSHPVDHINLITWQKNINQLFENQLSDKMKQPSWRTKINFMIKMLHMEVQEYFPDLSLFSEIPSILCENNLPSKMKNLVNEIMLVFENNITIDKMHEVYGTSINTISSIKIFLLKKDVIDEGKGLNWLSKLEVGIQESIKNVEAFLERSNELIARIDKISNEMHFVDLYSKRKQLFSIGFSIENQKRTNSFYDLLASEARQTSYICIARGEIPPTHWFRMDRTLTTVDGYKGLLSWTGTMFEYLMPLLVMKRYKHTLLDESYSFAVRCQKKYAAQRNMPWGCSESCFNSLDKNHDYQYKAIGVPWIGLKRGLIKDAVVAPYATFLALSIDPKGAMKNINRMRKAGLEGYYGFYEAADYTPERLSFENDRKIIKSFMSHHQGMSFVALNNFLNENVMQNRFHSDPSVNAAKLLLQEKSPVNFVLTNDAKKNYEPSEKVISRKSTSMRIFDKPNLILPKTHLLSNGSYSIMITDKGTGYSKTKMSAITRWREDVSLDSYGMFFYIRNMNEDKYWSATYSPLKKIPDDYKVIFTSDKAYFRRVDGAIETETEIMVTSGDPVEIRRITLKNKGSDECVLELTSYFEVVLAKQSDDIAHPSFSNLFIKTEYYPDLKCITATRRPRSEKEEGLWIANASVTKKHSVGDIQFETDRMKMIGRNRCVDNPISMEKGHFLSNTVGPVLDPVMSIRTMVKLEPGQETNVSFVTAIGASSESVLRKIQKYSNSEAIESAFQLALTRSYVETSYLNLDNQEVGLYQNLLSHILFNSPTKKQYQETICENKKGQSALWRYSISGDNPIVLICLKKEEPLTILYDVLKAHDYWHLMDLKVDLVVLIEEEISYNLPLFRLVSDIVLSNKTHETLNNPESIFILDRNAILPEDISLFYSVARIILKGDGRTIDEQMKVIEKDPIIKMVPSKDIPGKYPKNLLNVSALKNFNGLGGFKPDGQEYIIKLDKGQHTPAPWCNVISNPSFGFTVSDSGSGYTWFGNSRENKLTPWSNDIVSDPSGEILYLRDEDTGIHWTITSSPLREKEQYIVTHGFGYSIFEHTSHGIQQKLTQFVPKNKPVKISLVSLKNQTNHKKEISLTYYVRPVLGVSDQDTSLHIRTSSDNPYNLLIENSYIKEYPGKIGFISCSLKDLTMTGDRREFFGSGSVENPECLLHDNLSGSLGSGYDPCASVQGKIVLRSNETKDIVFILGMASNTKEVNKLSQKYRKIKKTQDSLNEIRKYWKNQINTLQIKTPDNNMDLLINGWLPYQIICCRLWAKSSFYQSSGAYGYRDQLQDCLSIVNISPEMTRAQILLHAKHQFVEGDVQHWWHEPSGKGTRTRISDDRLWLPYITSEYIRITGDFDILQEQVSFLKEPILKDLEEERYCKPIVTDFTSTLLDHCYRAINVSLKFGKHGLPLIGTGDWNDGMNKVGNKGFGESVWLGWFLFAVLEKMSSICEKIGENQKAREYRNTNKKILYAIENNGWDGNWYRRAYFDNGYPLGSILNTECKIDSIAQSWSVISGAANKQRASQAMKSLEDHLVLHEDGIITLLSPPFNEGDIEPGYIKGYLPGVRENGGQYTHAAAWAIIAFTKMEKGNKAWELFEMINPINHTRNTKDYSKYKVEPYVIAADVYSQHPHCGRGGWTWYTGSASWLYKAGIEYILGFKRIGKELIIDPCIPSTWEKFDISYKYLSATYNISVTNPERIQKGVKKIVLDKFTLKKNIIPLYDDREVHTVEVIMGNSPEQ